MSILKMIGGFLFAAGLTNMVVADSRPDVSQIINKAEASAILGEPVKDPSPRAATAPMAITRNAIITALIAANL